MNLNSNISIMCDESCYSGARQCASDINCRRIRGFSYSMLKEVQFANRFSYIMILLNRHRLNNTFVTI